MASDTAIRQEADTLTKIVFNQNPVATAQLPVPRLFDSFDLEGPNGVHNILALELLGSSLEDFITKMNWDLDKNYHNIGVLRELSRQMVYAVSYIHSKGIVHRGSKPSHCLAYKMIPG